MKKGFFLYQDQQETIERLTDNQAGKLFKAIYKYTSGNEPQLGSVLMLVFIPIRQALDRAQANYDKVSEVNSLNAKKRWDKIPKDAKTSEGMRSHANGYDKDKDINKDIKNSPYMEMTPTMRKQIFDVLEGKP